MDKLKFSDSHQVIYVDKVLRFGVSPSTCRKDVTHGTGDNDKVITTTIQFNTFFFLDAIKEIYEAIYGQDNKDKMEQSVQLLLEKFKEVNIPNVKNDK